MKFCTAPCIGNVTREQYVAQVRAACDFMDGQCEELARQLETDMKKAAAALDYEKAAELRDTLQDLRNTTQKTRKFVRLPYTLPVAIDPRRDLEELGRVLSLPAPPARIEGFDISNISGTFIVASMVSFHQGRPDRSNYRRYKMKTLTGQDDFAAMAETLRRRYSRLLRELEAATDHAPSVETGSGGDVEKGGAPLPLPDLILIDGGKGQLNAAVAELAKLGITKVPMIGLAKEFEEIYRVGESEPLRLPPDSGALKLLQRVRDESHRFANTFNAQLRLKKISESVLDEFPGIGEQRKKTLLRKFGSIQRLHMATAEQIAEVPGFGGRLAVELKAFLDARSATRKAPVEGVGMDAASEEESDTATP